MRPRRKPRTYQLLHRCLTASLAIFLSGLASARVCSAEALAPLAVPASSLIAVGDPCGAPGAGSCFAHNQTPGCDDPECCAMVCALDAYCCNTQWDESCAAIATQVCATSSCPGEGSCFIEHATPSCAEVPCCDTVCQTMPECCQTAWSAACVEFALNQCTLPAHCPAPGECLDPHESPGCDDPICCTLVCAHRASCCAAPWSAECVALTIEYCDVPAVCPGAGSCYAVHAGPGCDSESCCAPICANDPYCCLTAWDESCVAAAMVECAGIGACPGEGSCVVPHDGAACREADCCTDVCLQRPSCCLDTWDATCAAIAADACGLACPATGPCFEAHAGTGCEDAACCELVCGADAYCCGTAWDGDCATAAIQGCGPPWVCPGAGPCDEPGTTPGCDDGACCAAVCALQPACCAVAWTEDCVTAATSQCAGGCPPAQLAASVPPDGTVDARQPHLVTDALPRQGIGTEQQPILLTLDGARSAGCFSICETAIDPLLGPNGIAEVSHTGDGVHRIVLLHAITAGATTTIGYPGGTVTFRSHPANVNGDSLANPVDILALIDVLNGITAPPHGIHSSDIDRSAVAGPSDILRVIDLLNGAGAFDPWSGTSLSPAHCP